MEAMYWVILIIIVVVLALLVMSGKMPMYGGSRKVRIDDYLGGAPDDDGHDKSCCGCQCMSCMSGTCCGEYKAGGKFKLFMSPKLWESVKSGKKTYDIRYMNKAIENLQDGQEFIVQFSNLTDASATPPENKKIKVTLVSKKTDFKTFKDAFESVKGDHVYPGYSLKEAEAEFNKPFESKPEVKAKHDSEGTPFALLKFKLL